MQRATRRVGDHAQLTIVGHVPTCVLPAYWDRHALSPRDIECIVAAIPTRVLWISAVLHGFVPPWYSLHTSAATTFSVTLTGKTEAIEQLTRLRTSHGTYTDRIDRTVAASLNHVPPLPIHTIEKGLFDRMYANIVSHLMPAGLGHNTVDNEVPGIFPFKDLEMVPVSIEGPFICCNACTVITRDHVTSPARGGYTHMPKVGTHNGVRYALTDELMLFRSST